MTASKGPRPLYRGAATTLFLIVGILFLLAYAEAVPEGAQSINVSAPETRNINTAPTSINAEAGNLTELRINATRVTTSWQGYFGNITGSIVLQDASNLTFYQWATGTFAGEIYAANETVGNWEHVQCVNLTGNASDPLVLLNESVLESFYGILNTDNDGVGETFNTTYTDATGFNVGTVTINNEDSCPLTYTFVNGAAQLTSYAEVLLQVNNSVVFTTLINQNTQGYDSLRWDFQMLVAEDGSTAGATPYYFYVEVT